MAASDEVRVVQGYVQDEDPYCQPWPFFEGDVMDDEDGTRALLVIDSGLTADELRALIERERSARAWSEAVRRDLATWERVTTEGQRKAWDGVDDPPCGCKVDLTDAAFTEPVCEHGWMLDPDYGRDGEAWERFDFTEERYWRRAATDTRGTDGL